MNITELRYLVAIMECGSVSAAAKRLYAAQPNVSKALKNLEEEYHLRIFERSSTGMIPTEQGRHFIEQAERVLREVDRLDQSVQEAQERCAELRVMIPHATYASYAAVDYLEKVSSIERLHIHIREGGSMEALDHVLRQGYHLALLRYAVEDDEHYTYYCARRGLKMEPIMDFEYSLLTNRDGPLARKEIRDCLSWTSIWRSSTMISSCPARRAATVCAGMSTRNAVSTCMSGAASSRSCSGCPRPTCGHRPCPAGHWSSTIWC